MRKKELRREINLLNRKVTDLDTRTSKKFRRMNESINKIYRKLFCENDDHLFIYLRSDEFLSKFCCNNEILFEHVGGSKFELFSYCERCNKLFGLFKDSKNRVWNELSDELNESGS